MVSVLVVFEPQDCTETVGPLAGFAVFGIPFGDFRRYEFLAGDLHAFYERCNTGA
jgi:hypothetical protein